MTETLTIKIPVELARYAVWQRSLVTKYETNQVIRALDTWLVLKSETRCSWIQHWRKQREHLLKICKVSETIFRHRLKLLASMKLLKVSKTDIRLYSWQQLEKVLGISTDQKFTIQYNVNDKAKLQQWFIATEIKDNQSRQAYKVIQKLNKNPELNMIVTGAVLKAGADRDRINNAGYFLSWLKVLYQNDFIQASDIHAELIEIRPDTNRGVRAMASAWSCRSPQTVSYWKKVLQGSGIIDIGKLQIKSSGRVRNKHCKVLWLKQDRETLLCLCDQILVLEPWLIQENKLAA